MYKKNLKYLSKNLACLIAGALLPLAFMPYDWWLLAILSPVVLLWAWKDARYKQAFFCGFLYGAGKYGVGVYWVFISIHRFGGSNIAISFILTLGFVLLLAFFIGLQGLLFRWCTKRATGLSQILIFPATWVITEWVFEWFLTGFPWLYLGNSQVSSPLAGYAPVFGIFGVSFIVALCAALLFTAITKRAMRAYFCLFGLLIITITGWALYQVNWSTPLPNTLKIAMIQGNTPLLMQWNPEAIDMILEKYQRLSAPYWKHYPLVIWPENAIPLPKPYAAPFFANIDKTAKQYGGTLITGNPVPAPNEAGYFNSMRMIGKNQGIYYKRHLVPFGEYLPMASLLRGMINFFNLPMSDFVSGPEEQTIFNVNGLLIAPFICYEIAYSDLVRHDLPHANLLLTISNDAWFGGSAASWQQFEIGQMQAIATARPLITVTNNGITGIINTKGEVTALAAPFTTHILTSTVQGYTGCTPWVYWGNWPIILFAFLIIFALRFKRT